MIELDVFLPKIMPYAPGCPEPMALEKIIVAAQIFCERTRLWRDRDKFNVTPTSCNVMCAPVGANVFEIESARFNERTLDPISLADLEAKYPNWRQYSETEGRWFTQVEPDTVMVVPAATGVLELSLILRPTDDADQLPDFIGAHYRQCIADGALAELLMTPGQSFYAPDRAQYYAARFASKLDELTTRSIRGQQRAPVRTRAQFM